MESSGFFSSFPNLIFSMVAVLVCIFIQAAILRWIFKINQQISNQQATIGLLINLCPKSGVDPKQIEELKAYFRI